MPLPPAGPAPAPSTAALELPEALNDLEAWMIACLITAAPGTMPAAARRIQAVAAYRFGAHEVAETLRRVLGMRLVGRR